MVQYQCFLFWMCISMVLGEEEEVHPDTLLTNTGIIEKYGYPWEAHEINTKDGYILTIYRIPHGKGGSGINDKTVLMMHGLFGCSENYIISAMQNSSMAFYFADRGYDVWLGNSRGNLHSRKHKSLNPDKPNFWKFTWHEIGIYDMPAMVDHILEKSGSKKLYYIGHSQGGTVFYIMNSLKPEYQEKIERAVLLAPAGIMKNFNNTLVTPLLKYLKRLLKMAANGKLYEVPPPWFNFTQLALYFLDSPFKPVFYNVFEVFVGGDSKELNRTLLRQIFRFFSPASLLQLAHYGQTITSGRFRQWDHGTKKNLLIYGTEEPPDYPIENIRVPICLFYSLNDNLVYPQDAIDTCNKLQRCEALLMQNEMWTHLDYVFSSNLVTKIHEPAMKCFNRP